MYVNLLLPLLLLLTAYALAIRLLVRGLRAAGVPAYGAVWLSFVLFGVLSGALAAGLWPHDSAVYSNVAAVWTGDVLHWAAVHLLGNPASDHAARTVPVWLQLPLVYVTAGLFLGAVCGAPAQWLVNRQAGRRLTAADHSRQSVTSHPVGQQ